MLSFKKTFMDEMEKGLRRRLKTVEATLKKSPEKYGLGTKEARVPQLEDNSNQLPLMPKNVERKAAAWRDALTPSRVTQKNLSGGYGLSLRSQFESLTQKSKLIAEQEKTADEGTRKIMGPEKLTQAQSMSQYVLQKANKEQQIAMNRALAKKRAIEGIRKRLKSGL